MEKRTTGLKGLHSPNKDAQKMTQLEVSSMDEMEETFFTVAEPIAIQIDKFVLTLFPKKVHP